MNFNNAIEVLKKNIIDQARYYLQEADEFFPFGAVISKNDEVKPIGIYSGEDFPSANDVLIKLEKGIKEGIENHDYQYAAIGLDVYINTNTSKEKEKKTALEIRLYSGQSTSKRYYLEYYNRGDKYYFQELPDLTQNI